MNLYQQTIPVFRNGLTMLQGLLKKAQAHPKGEGLLNARLADDMHPLAVQIRFVSNQPGEAVARLTDCTFLSRDDNDESFVEARNSLKKTDALLAEIDESEFMERTATLVLDLSNGMEFTMSADQFVRDWALPNFYFHLTAAYAILRSEGLEIGKADFLPQMTQYATKIPGN